MTTIDINSELQFHDGAYLVAGFHGSLLKLRNSATGEYSTAHIADISRRLIEPLTRNSVNVRELDFLTKKEGAQLDKYGSHIQEMICGVRGDGPDAVIKPEYDPSITTLNQRVTSKVEELTRLGIPASRATLLRKKKAFEAGGVAALLDGRTLRKEGPLDRADARLMETLIHLIAEETFDSTGTGSRLIRRLTEELLRAYPGQNIPIPSETTLYRYIGYLTKGKYTTGSAPTRRTAANTPKRPFGTAVRLRPGQEVQIDSSPWDVLVRSEDGSPSRASLTIMVDIATRSILAVSVRAEATKGVDHAYLLAQCMVPRPLRPGNEELWRLTARRMPWGVLVPEEERVRLDMTRPFIYPERIMMDNGADYRSNVFESACRKFGISLTYAAPHTPTDKAIVERTFHSIKTLFAQDLPGYKGGAVSERGLEIEKGALLDIATLTERFEEWITRVWQNRPHDSLFDPLSPTVKLTPNEMYDASFDIAAQLPLPLDTEDYIDLLPTEYRTILPAGVKVNNRFYDSIELQPFRGSPSSDTAHDNKWEVRSHPYNPRLIWVRHPDGHWMECLWRAETTFNQPFADTILQAAVASAAARGEADLDDLAQVAADIRKRTTASAVTVRKAKARNALAIELAEAAGTPMPTRTTPSPATPFQEPTTVAQAAASDDDEYDDEYEMDSYYDMDGEN